VARQYRTNSCQISKLGCFVDEKRRFGFSKLNIFGSDRSDELADAPHEHVGMNKKQISGERIAVTAIPHLRKWLDVRISGGLYS
jgi:hypothetical protein